MRCEVSTFPPATAAGRKGVHDRAAGRDQADGAHQPGSRRYVFGQQTAKHVEARGVGNGLYSIGATRNLRIGAGEIDRHHASAVFLRKGDFHRDAHGFRCGFERTLIRKQRAIVIEKILGLAAAIGNGCEKGLHDLLGVIEQCPSGLCNPWQSVPRTHLPQAQFSGMACGNLRAEVSLSFARGTHIGEQQGEQVAIHGSSVHDLHRRDPETFLVDLAAQSHGAGEGAANIRMMSTRCHEKVRLRRLLAANEDWRDERYVGQMGAAAEGIVDDGDVASLQFEILQNRTHAHRHRPKMHRHVISHRERLACSVKDRAGVIAPLLDVRRESRATQSCTHFFRDGMKNTFENLQFDGIGNRGARAGHREKFIGVLPPSTQELRGKISKFLLTFVHIPLNILGQWLPLYNV